MTIKTLIRWGDDIIPIEFLFQNQSPKENDGFISAEILSSNMNNKQFLAVSGFIQVLIAKCHRITNLATH